MKLPRGQCCRSCNERSRGVQMVEPGPWWVCLRGSYLKGTRVRRRRVRESRVKPREENVAVVVGFKIAIWKGQWVIYRNRSCVVLWGSFKKRRVVLVLPLGLLVVQFAAALYILHALFADMTCTKHWH